MIEQNLTTALILEDDADWDIRIKTQMEDFAKASRLLVQPLSGTTDKFLDPTYPKPEGNQQPTNFDIQKDVTGEPATSPYGDIDRWDLLWLGHCGAHFPGGSDQIVPLGRAIIPEDQTVPAPQHIKMQFGDDELVQQYPAHTRVASHVSGNTCTLAYALSLPGARRLLYELGVNKMTGPTDLMLNAVCTGSEGRTTRTCLTVQPQLFQHHRPVGPKGKYSDIADHSGEYNKKAFTRNVRWSTRINFANLLDGKIEYVDSYEDGEPADTEIDYR